MTTTDSRWIALIVLCAGTLMTVVDATAVYVALPTMQSGLGIAQADLTWVVNAYLIPFGGCCCSPAARRPDRRETGVPRRCWLFTAASVACGLAESHDPVHRTLRAGRRRRVHHQWRWAWSYRCSRRTGTRFRRSRVRVHRWRGLDRPDRGCRTDQRSAGDGSSSSTCPSAWRPCCLRCATWTVTRGSAFGPGADVAGGALVTAALMLASTDPRDREVRLGVPRTLGLGALAIALLVAFIARKSRTENPLVPLHIFRSRQIAGANVVQMLTVAGLFGMFFLGVLDLQRVLGYDVLETGLAFLPVSLLIGILSLGFSARLSERYGATRRAAPRAGADRRRAARLRAGTGRDWSDVGDVLPVMIPLGIGAGRSSPRSPSWRCQAWRRASPAWRPGSSTRASRLADRSAWPCWPHCPRPAPRTCSPMVS